MRLEVFSLLGRVFGMSLRTKIAQKWTSELDPKGAALPLRKDGGNLSTENRDEKFWPAQFCLCQFDCFYLSRSELISHFASSETICHFCQILFLLQLQPKCIKSANTRR